MGQPPERVRIFAGGRELSTDAALVRNCGLGPGHVMHGQKSLSNLTSCALSSEELQRLWEGTPKEVLAGLVRNLAFPSSAALFNAGHSAAQLLLVAFAVVQLLCLRRTSSARVNGRRICL